MSSLPAPRALDSNLCPLCGQPNTCAMETQRITGQPQPPCWCTLVDFSRELLSQVPEPARNLACICSACATRQQ
ncbi:cysteine-rich CWC family protein [Ramlibacter sp. Leaf400]|uniref:cysteine-rich CWC family protein n=1 Tax=Ramlibacter sp. Leaf400 TaxID=1736365 RepID=UPI0006FB114D|nr:cysteine-rich CWC family protein [Ramlibacter sp. Leaf400]KQT12170.1 hypothetical protein ASG30_02375 [Ramlibacter sp. Leaf400]